MQLVEQHVIARGDRRYPPIDAAAFASKNLWNAANAPRAPSLHQRGELLEQQGGLSPDQRPRRPTCAPAPGQQSGADPAPPGLGCLL
jgi:hypothetical protein